jgi:hypothetical protein
LNIPSKKSVKNASKRIVIARSTSKAAAEDIETIDRWRKAHLKPLTAISMWLRRPAQDATGLPPAQRLKRRNTVLDKIMTGRSSDAATMHDLGGCRVIFKNLQSLADFRDYMVSKSRARHELLHDSNKYDYILNPKATGYRGVHYVYGYGPSSRRNACLSGMRIEIQLRTEVQHAWATAVETADLVLGARIKFEDGTGTYGEFFRLASELLSRFHEDCNGCLSDASTAELKERFYKEEARTQLLDRLDKLKEQGDLTKIRKHTILAFRKDDTLEIFGYTKAARAVLKEAELLEDENLVHVVYVRASTTAAIRNSYRNYLTNPADFVSLMNDALA